MVAQVSQYGDMALVNHLSGAQTLTAAGSAPSWKPGDVYYNTGSSTFEQWNGSAWVTPPTGAFSAGSLPRYLALLTADPVAGGAVNISDAGFIELTTSTGYSRQQVTFSNATNGYPSSASNNSVITFEMSLESMPVPVGWAALVTCSSGSNGLFLASWVLAQAYQVEVSQSVQVGIGQLTLQGQ
jgi:hypothetical protein